MAEENVIVVSFEEEAKAYQAASILRQADADGRIDMHAAAIVQRTEDGTLRVKEGEIEDFPAATWTATALGAATGGIIGLTLGVLGGPLGVLLGGTYGMLLGSLIDLSAEEEERRKLVSEKHNEEQKENGEQKGKVGEKIERLKAKLAGS